MISGADLAWEGDFIDAIWDGVRAGRDAIAHVRLVLSSTGSTVDIAMTAVSIEPISDSHPHAAPLPLLQG